MILNLILFLVMLFGLIKSSQYAIDYSAKLAKSLHLSEFLISFFIIAIISTFPETTIGIVSALEGIPEFGLGTLFGGNIADLTLVLGLVALFSKKDLFVRSNILRKNLFYLFLLFLPVLLGFDGRYSRIDGIILIGSCVLFFFNLYIESGMFKKKYNGEQKSVKNILLLILSLIILLLTAYFTVKFGVNFAYDINIPPVLVGLVLVSLGTCLPELFFSIRAVRNNHNNLAIGDLLGTVVIDSTLVIGIISVINPFTFNKSLIYIAGFSMFIAGVIAMIFLKSNKRLSKKEAIWLLLFYFAYLALELITQRF